MEAQARKFLKLAMFALLFGNVALYGVGMLARSQVLSGASNASGKIQTAFIQALERAKKTSAGQAASIDSPYLNALREVRKQYPAYRLRLSAQGMEKTKFDQKIAESLKGKPQGWSYTDEKDGWARSFIALPTRTPSMLEVSSYVKDELNAWKRAAILIGAYAFVLLFAFGWFWSRALDESPSVASIDRSKLLEKIQAIAEVEKEFGLVLSEITRIIETIERQPANESAKSIEEITSQIRMLSVNGSIEAARSADTYRVFHVIMQEIGQLATQARALSHGLADQTALESTEALQKTTLRLKAALSGEQGDGASGSSGQNRAG